MQLFLHIWVIRSKSIFTAQNLCGFVLQNKKVVINTSLLNKKISGISVNYYLFYSSLPFFSLEYAVKQVT